MPMVDCQHHWSMTDVEFGYVVFEKCYHCKGVRTFFSTEDTPVPWEKYREGDCFWNRVEVAQSFRFNLECARCGRLEEFSDVMGFLFCTGCMDDCEVEKLQKKCEAERTWVLVAFGHLSGAKTDPIPQRKIDLLTDYFNQRRDTSRSRMKIVSFDMIKDLTRCKGEFIHDVGMLSEEPPGERKPVF